MIKTGKITLASKSPRRAEILRQLGLKFDILHPDVNEIMPKKHDFNQIVMKNSRLKAMDVAARVEDGIVISADTIVVLDGKVLGKPADSDDAVKMLTALSGKNHSVYTGFTVYKIGAREVTDFARTEVKFRVLEPWEIDAYVATDKPLDKAGAYGIQDMSGVFVTKIHGCYFNVVGLPLAKFYNALHLIWGQEKLQRFFTK